MGAAAGERSTPAYRHHHGDGLDILRIPGGRVRAQPGGSGPHHLRAAGDFDLFLVPAEQPRTQCLRSGAVGVRSADASRRLAPLRPATPVQFPKEERLD